MLTPAAECCMIAAVGSAITTHLATLHADELRFLPPRLQSTTFLDYRFAPLINYKPPAINTGRPDTRHR